MQTTQNSQALIEQEIISNFIQTSLRDGLLGEQFHYDLTEFSHGNSITIPSIGEVTIQEASEDTPLVYTPLETGSITLRGFTQKGDAWYITDDLREDAMTSPNLLDALIAQRSYETSRAIKVAYETDFFNTVGQFYVDNPQGNVVNGYNHLINAVGAGGAFNYRDLIALKLAFDKANVPAEGRILFVPPEVEASFLGQMVLVPDANSYTLERLKDGFTAGMRYIHSWLGFELIVTNRLPTITIEIAGADVTGVLCVAMCVADDNTKPVASVWRRQPKTEYERNKDMRRDEWVTTCRYMFGIKRYDTLGGILVAPDVYTIAPGPVLVTIEQPGTPSDPEGTVQPGAEAPEPPVDPEPPVSGG